MSGTFGLHWSSMGGEEQPGHLALVSMVAWSAFHHLTGLYTWAKDKTGT